MANLETKKASLCIHHRRAEKILLVLDQDFSGVIRKARETKVDKD